MFQKPIAVGAVDKEHVQGLGVFQGLLHPRTDFVAVVLGFDNGEGNVGPIQKEIVDLFGFAPGDDLSPNDDPSLGEEVLFPNLRHQVPTFSQWVLEWPG